MDENSYSGTEAVHPAMRPLDDNDAAPIISGLAVFAVIVCCGLLFNLLTDTVSPALWKLLIEVAVLLAAVAWIGWRSPRLVWRDLRSPRWAAERRPWRRVY